MLIWISWLREDVVGKDSHLFLLYDKLSLKKKFHDRHFKFFQNTGLTVKSLRLISERLMDMFICFWAESTGGISSSSIFLSSMISPARLRFFLRLPRPRFPGALTCSSSPIPSSQSSPAVSLCLDFGYGSKNERYNVPIGGLITIEYLPLLVVFRGVVEIGFVAFDSFGPAETDGGGRFGGGWRGYGRYPRRFFFLFYFRHQGWRSTRYEENVAARTVFTRHSDLGSEKICIFSVRLIVLLI